MVEEVPPTNVGIPRNLPRVVYDGYKEVKKVAGLIICLRQKEPAGGRFG